MGQCSSENNCHADLCHRSGKTFGKDEEAAEETNQIHHDYIYIYIIYIYISNKFYQIIPRWSYRWSIDGGLSLGFVFFCFGWGWGKRNRSRPPAWSPASCRANWRAQWSKPLKRRRWKTLGKLVGDGKLWRFNLCMCVRLCFFKHIFWDWNRSVFMMVFGDDWA